jgi:MFS family permease
VYAAKLNWTGEDTRFYNSLVNFSSQIGKTIGAFVGGQMIMRGRKKVFIYSNVVALLSVLIMQIMNIYCLCIGKFINGVFVTMVHIA